MKTTHAVIRTTSGTYGVASIERAESLEANRVVCLTTDGERARRLAELFNEERSGRDAR